MRFSSCVLAMCSLPSFVLTPTLLSACCVCVCVCAREEEDSKVSEKGAKKATPQAPPTAPASHPQRAGAKIVVYSAGEQSSPLSQGSSLLSFLHLGFLYLFVFFHTPLWFSYTLCLFSYTLLPLTLLESFSTLTLDASLSLFLLFHSPHLGSRCMIQSI